jgi:DNA (cytosine-5)-methyltransferase 1
MKGLNYLDLFSGCGGFHKGLEQAGFEFNWVGHSEVDKYACEVYHNHFPESECLGDIKSIRPEELPRINLITFGFPCQDLSVAGKRRGLDGKRSGLFFEAMRIVETAKPEVFIFENVKGLLSSSEGRDFEVVLRTVADLGIYDCEWQLVNTRWVLPQNRERIFFIGHLRGASRPKVFPITEDAFISPGEFKKESREWKWFQTTNTSSTITSPEKMRNTDTYIGPVNSPYITNPKMNNNKPSYDASVAITATSFKEPPIVSGIRRLTPVECARLQGFPDDWHNGLSDTQSYKVYGNAVTVDIVEMIGRRLT